jgi:hypothetical protein
LGNSEDIARKHYYQTTDDHFAQAASGTSSEGGAESGAPVAQNQAQRAQAGNRGDSQAANETADATTACATSSGTPRKAAIYKGGWGGIRTHGRLATSPVFKTGAFNRSATHPIRRFLRVFRHLFEVPTIRGFVR